MADDPNKPAGDAGNPNPAPNPNPPAPGPLAPAPVKFDWFGALPADYQKEPSLASFKDKDFIEVVKSNISAQKMIGGSVRIPGKDATPEEVSAYWTKLGVPAAPADYKLAAPAMAEGVTIADPELRAFETIAHKLHLNPEQANGLLAYVGQLTREKSQLFADDLKAAETKLREEFGPNYERKMAYSKRAIMNLGGEAVMDKIDASGLGSDPDFIKWVAGVADKLVEHNVIVGEVDGVFSKGDAQAKIDAINADQKHPYWSKEKNDPEHIKAVLEMNRLLTIVHGDEQPRR